MTTRVLFVHPFAYTGGSENVLVRLVQSLDPRFVPTVVLMERGPFEHEFERLGIPCHVISLPGKRSVPRFPFTAGALAERIGSDYAVIHANGTKAAMFATYLGRRMGVPVLWMKHAHDFDRLAPRIVGPACDRIVCVSRAVAATFPDWLQDRVTVCHPGVGLPATTPATDTEPLVVMAGRFDPLKGFDNVIRAIAMLRDRGVDGRIAISGAVTRKSPGHAEELADLIARLDLEDRASILGWVTDMDALYRQARVVAMASTTPSGKAGAEGAGLVLLEGMSHARPVVAPDDGGMAEIVGDAGTLVKQPEPDQLADALGPYLSDAAHAERIGSRGRQRVEREFSLEQMASKMESEYTRLAAGTHLGGPEARTGGAGSAVSQSAGSEPELSDPAGEAEAQEGGGAFRQSRRMVTNTLGRSIGEVVAKLASIAFYIVMARELGTADFGSFIFGLSLSSIVLVGAGFGMDQYLTREISRDRRAVDALFSNVLALKAIMLVALMGVLSGIVLIGPYSGETRLAVVLVGLGVGIEMLTFASQSVMQGYERMHLVAVGLVTERMVTAVLGILILLSGGGLIAASIVFVGGSAVGYLVSHLLMRARVVRPRFVPDRSEWRQLLRASAPIGVAALFFTVLLRLDTTMISFLTDGDQVQVGYYGAAYRLVDATMFIGLSVSAAMLPWLARQRDRDSALVTRGSVIGLKLLVAVLMPIGTAYVVFAPSLIDILYGPEFEDAVLPLRFLGAMTVLYGINWYSSSLLIARMRPGAAARGIVAVLILNIALNVIVIPPYGASGAAAVAAVSGLVLAVYSVRQVWSTVGRFTVMRTFAGPLLASAVMAENALLLGLPFGIALAISGASYLVALVAVERTFFTDDFNQVRVVLQAFRRPGAEVVEAADLR